MPVISRSTRTLRTRTRSGRRRGAVWMAVVGVFSALVVVGTVSPALACDNLVSVTHSDGTVTTVCQDGNPGTTDPGGNTGGSGSTQPACDLEGEYDDLCIGDDACWMNDPAAVQDPAELEGVPKPEEDSYVVYIKCQRPDGSTYDRWYWNQDVPTITIEDRILSAVGALDLPTIQASYNPPNRTLVNLPTWWWAEGAPPGEIQGSEALGAVAFAVPRGLSVVPGDGSPSFACPMSVTKSDTCSYEYRRAGDYTATMSIVYDIRIEIGGTAIPTNQIPPDVRSITVDDDVPVQVREVQTRVTKTR